MSVLQCVAVCVAVFPPLPAQSNWSCEPHANNPIRGNNSTYLRKCSPENRKLSQVTDLFSDTELLAYGSQNIKPVVSRSAMGEILGRTAPAEG